MTSIDELLALVDRVASPHLGLSAVDDQRRSALRRGIVALGEEQRRDRADAERFRDMARGYMDERDEARSILATTADRLNTALRESGCCEMIGDHMQGLAIRDGIVALYGKGAQWRKDRDALRAENAKLIASLREECKRRCAGCYYECDIHEPRCFAHLLTPAPETTETE